MTMRELTGWLLSTFGDMAQTLATFGTSAPGGNAERGPFDYHVITYLWVLLVSGFAGWVGWMRKVRQGRARAFNIAELIGELATSALAGVITFWLCEWQHVPELLAAVLIAISGHMGTRAIFLLEMVVESWPARRGIKLPGDADGPK